MILQAEDFIGGVEISTQLNNLISLTNQPTAFQFYLSVSGQFLLRFGGCRRLGGRRGETGVDLVAEARQGDPEAVMVIRQPGGGVDGVDFGPSLVKDVEEGLGLVGVLLFLLEALEGFRFFDRCQVLALEVFDERDFCGVAVDEDAGNLGETDLLGGGDAAFTGHDRVFGGQVLKFSVLRGKGHLLWKAGFQS